MASGKRKILILVEGAKTDVALMEHLLKMYEIDVKYEIVSYCTNIYTLYSEMFLENDPSSIDLKQLLKGRESSKEKKGIFDENYSDILLIFDLDPQAPDFDAYKIQRMADYFTESSDMGKLFINYPMVEAFYHMASIPDEHYDEYYATLEELAAGNYKSRVNCENRNRDYRKFAVNKTECSIVIRQNIQKAYRLINSMGEQETLPEQKQVLNAQLGLLNQFEKVAVLSTCPFFIPEYNPALIL